MGKVVKDEAVSRRIIGLTGGIATGKSTVSDYLARRYELPVLDADVFSREAVAKGSEILERVRDRYGPDSLLLDGSLNRAYLGKIIFSQLDERQWVEQQIHPYVRARFSAETNALPAHQTLIYSIPLLFEANLTHLVSETWVVVCSSAQQLARLMHRNQLTKSQAQARIEAQMSLDEKCKRADYVLDNTQSKEALFFQVDRLIAFF